MKAQTGQSVNLSEWDQISRTVRWAVISLFPGDDLTLEPIAVHAQQH